MSKEALVALISGPPEGEQSRTLYQVARGMRSGGFAQEDAMAFLWKNVEGFTAYRPDEPWTEADVERIVESVYTSEREMPPLRDPAAFDDEDTDWLTLASQKLDEIILSDNIEELQKQTNIFARAYAQGDEDRWDTLYYRLAGKFKAPRFAPKRWLGKIKRRASSFRPAANDAPSLDDIGSAVRFTGRWGSDFRYVEDEKRWRRWSGTHWREATESDLANAWQTVADELSALEKPDNTEADERAWEMYLSSCRSQRGLQGMLKFAIGQEALRSVSVDFDQRKDLFAVRNGTIEMVQADRTRGIIGGWTFHAKHRREDMLTQMASVSYLPGKKNEIVEKFFETTFPVEQERLYVKRVLSYGISGWANEQVFPIWKNPEGGNGKGTLALSCVRLWGDYGSTASQGALELEDAAEIGRELAEYKKVRLLVLPETRDGARFNWAVVRALSGEDSIRGNPKHQKKEDFDNRLTPICLTNTLPAAKSSEGGTWRRVQPLEFRARFSEEDKDKLLRGRLEDPDDLGSYLFTSIVDGGLSAWLQDGLNPPESVLEAATEYRDASDPYAEFFEEWVTLTGIEEVYETTEDVYDAYLSWWRDVGGGSRAKTKFEFKKIMQDEKRLQPKRKVLPDGSKPNIWPGVKILRTRPQATTHPTIRMKNR